MPRGPRLDAPGVLHHVMVRGVNRQVIFRNDQDREDFVRKIAGHADAGALTVYAWALLSNHLHLLVRTGTRPLARVMRSLLTGYAGAFNRRHQRIGHLFQNRYKSIVVEEDVYLLELVRYLHLNPLRAGVVPDLRQLHGYPWTGHSAILGRVPRHWQATQEVLTRFGPTPRQARAAYCGFMAAGLSQGRRPELEGGGLLRSVGGWQAVQVLRRGWAGPRPSPGARWPSIPVGGIPWTQRTDARPCAGASSCLGLPGRPSGPGAAGQMGAARQVNKVNKEPLAKL